MAVIKYEYSPNTATADVEGRIPFNQTLEMLLRLASNSLDTVQPTDLQEGELWVKNNDPSNNQRTLYIMQNGGLVKLLTVYSDSTTTISRNEATLTSTTATANNAQIKANSVEQALTTKLDNAGGTITGNLKINNDLTVGTSNTNVLTAINNNASAIDAVEQTADGALQTTGGTMTGELIGRSDTDLPTSFTAPNRPNTLYSCQYSFNGDDNTGTGATRTYSVGQRMSYAGLSGYALPAFELLSNIPPFSSIVKIHNELGVAVGTDNYVNLSDVKSIANTADANASSALARLLELAGLMVQGQTISVGGGVYVNIYDIPSSDNVILRNGSNSMTGQLDMGAGYQGVNDKLSVPIKFNGRTDRNPYHDIKIRAVYNVASDTSLLEFYNDTGGFLNYLQIRATGISGNNFATTVPAPRPIANVGLGQWRELEVIASGGSTDLGRCVYYTSDQAGQIYEHVEENLTQSECLSHSEVSGLYPKWTAYDPVIYKVKLPAGGTWAYSCVVNGVNYVYTGVAGNTVIVDNLTEYPTITGFCYRII